MVYPYRVKFGGKYYAAGENVPDDANKPDLSVPETKAVNSTPDAQNVEIEAKVLDTVEKRKVTSKPKKK